MVGRCVEVKTTEPVEPDFPNEFKFKFKCALRKSNGSPKVNILCRRAVIYHSAGWDKQEFLAVVKMSIL